MEEKEKRGVGIFVFLHPAKNGGTPGRIRTCDPLIRSQVLYPAELLVHRSHCSNKISFCPDKIFWWGTEHSSRGRHRINYTVRYNDMGSFASIFLPVHDHKQQIFLW